MYRLRRADKTLDSATMSSRWRSCLAGTPAAEAKKVLDEGFASGLLGKGNDAERQKRLLALATQRYRRHRSS